MKNWIISLLAIAVVILSVRLITAGGNDSTSQQKMENKEFKAEASAAYESILTRHSVRAYSKEHLSDDTVEKILRAGMAAPSAMDKRPWEFVVVTKQELKEAIATKLPNARMAAEAPLVVVVCGDKRRFIEDAEEYWVQDCSAVTENMLLAAHALGLGGVWCGIHPIIDREKTLDDILNLPADLYPLNVVCFGIPASQQEPKNKWDATRIHYNKF